MTDDTSEHIPLLMTATARERYPVIWKTVSENLPTLTDDQIAVAVSIIIYNAQIAYQEAMRHIAIKQAEMARGMKVKQ